MNAYEKNLLNGIPQDEAASYFLRVTGRDKVAQADLQEAWNELTPAEQDEILKEAMEQGLIPKEATAPMGPPPAPASMPAPSPITLPPTAQGQNSVKTAKNKKAEEGGVTSGSTDADGDPTLEEYLRQEAMGADAEQQMGADFYRQRLMAAQQELEQTRAQAEQTAAQAEQLQQQVAQNDEVIQASMQQAQMAQQTAMANVQQAHQMTMDATNQAMESQAEVLRQKQLAAAMRMGVQTLKDNVMNAMAQDPTDQLAQQLQAPPPGSGGMPVGGQPPAPPAPIDPMTGQPMVDPAMAGQDPNAAAGGPPAPASGGGEGGGEKKPSSGEGGEKKEKSESKSEKKDDDKKDKDDDGGKTHVEVKTGSVQERFLAAVRGIK